MSLPGRKIVSLTLAVALALPLAALSAPRAEASSILDVLLGRNKKPSAPEREKTSRERTQNSERRQQKPEGSAVVEKKRKKVAKQSVDDAADPQVYISAPSYYTYKMDTLKPVDMAVLPATTLVAAAGVTALDAAPSVPAAAGASATRLMAEEPVVEALDRFYKARPAFVWTTGDMVNARAVEAMRVLAEADSFGLNPADYAVALPQSQTGADDRARHAELARFELALSARLLRYVRDASGGRIDPNRISGYHDFPAKPLNYLTTMGALVGAPDIHAYLESRHPQNAEYRALHDELVRLRQASEKAVELNANVLLRPGAVSPDLPAIAAELATRLDGEAEAEHRALLAGNGTNQTYSAELVPAVMQAQKKIGVRADGIIGPRTVRALVGPSSADRIAKLVLALEQMRWLPSDLGARRVFVNQPAFTAAYFEDDTEKLKMRVVVGAKATQTSFFYDKIEQVDFNPYWGVPQSIIVNEMLPRLRRDPGYLDRAGYEVTDARGKKVRSSAVSWGKYGAKVPYNVRQVPGARNALGELKILFPNKHAIYMHDTPAKGLFQAENRAFSHGCIRLNDPRAMAAAVLGKPLDYVAKKLAQGHSMERVPEEIPVYVAYFTAWPNAEGAIEYFADVYDRDASLKAAMDKTDAQRMPAS